MKALLIVCAVAFAFAAAAQDTVYVTPTGTKYHYKTCQYVGVTAVPVELDSTDLDPCKRCVLAVKTRKAEIPSIQCAGTTTTGSRCKRQTKTIYCYQHKK